MKGKTLFFLGKHKKRICFFVLIIICAALFLGAGIINQITGRRAQDVISVALVYRYTDYAWGQEDNLYIIRQDGAVFNYHKTMKGHEDGQDDSDKNFDWDDDLLNTVLRIYSDDANIRYELDEIPDFIKDILYSLDYGAVSLKYKTDSPDAPAIAYYALTQDKNGNYGLVKLKEEGGRISKSRYANRKLNLICRYVEDSLSEVWETDVKDGS